MILCYLLHRGNKYGISLAVDSLNSLHPNIRVHILHTFLYTFLNVLTRRIWSEIKSYFSWLPFPLFSRPQCVIQEGYCKEKLDASHSQESKA